MKVFIVALPLFDSTMTVSAYRLSARSGEKALGVKNDFRGMSEVFLSPGLDLTEKLGPEPFAGEKPLFIELNRFQLLTGVPTNMNINPAKIVCELPGGMTASPDILERMEALQQKGYAMALDCFPLSGIQSPFFQYVNYLILDYNNPRFFITFKAVRAQLPHITIVAASVPDMEAYTLLSSTEGALFSGAFYNQPITQGLSDISPIKINALQLLNQVNEPDFELEEITKIIERDPSLSISLLKFINSGAVGLKNKVGSISSAVAIMGQNEVRRWATVAISVGLAEDRPGEITKLSLVRAKFAENLATAFELGVFQNSLFMAGLFSLLDVILQKPMPEAINEVAVEEKVLQTLVHKTGSLHPVMELIYTYERADWDLASILMIRAGVGIEAVNKAFIDALVWYHDLLDTIDEETPEKK